MVRAPFRKMKPAPDPHACDYSYAPDAAVESAIHAIRLKYPASYPEGLSRVRGVLARLGDPHLRLPPVYHVAGTNGKGSTLSFLQAIFEAEGKSVHKFTSPHLVRFEERIVLNGQPIASGHLLSLMDDVEKVAGGDELSFFEFFTVLAFLAYQQTPADAVLLETGMGGTHDATNVIDTPECSILTRISFDHTHVLGRTLTDIAAQKAGIIKRGCRVVIAPQEDAGVTNVFTATAAAMDAPVTPWSVSHVDDGGFDFASAFFTGRLPRPSLVGRHQVDNAAAAMAAYGRPSARFADALLAASWPGRMQQITVGRLPELLPADWELWVDGAHNDSGAAAVAQQAADWGQDKPLHILTAYKKNKNIGDFYDLLLPVAATVQAVDFPIDVPMTSSADIAAYINGRGGRGSVAENLESAIRALVFTSDAPARILVAGSLYLAGHTLRRNA
jgi:dihydrofolate synthase/folylpolyglutamate synthase